jgi:hypothetical protein
MEIVTPGVRRNAASQDLEKQSAICLEVEAPSGIEPELPV